MAWEVWWALVLGFALSGIVQAWVPRARLERALGGAGARQIALATGLGAASSSCSYAAIAIAKSLFQKGAELRLGDGLPVRVDEPRLRARHRDVDLPRLAVHARGVRRRHRPDRADVARRAPVRLRGGSRRRRARTRLRRRRTRARVGGVRRRSCSRSTRGRRSRTTSAATSRCSGRRSSPAS